MDDLVEVVEVIHSKSNEELGRYIKDDMLTDENFGLSLVQARFLLEVANRLESCRCWNARIAKCEVCEGAGTIGDTICYNCGGTGDYIEDLAP